MAALRVSNISDGFILRSASTFRPSRAIAADAAGLPSTRFRCIRWTPSATASRPTPTCAPAYSSRWRLSVLIPVDARGSSGDWQGRSHRWPRAPSFAATASAHTGEAQPDGAERAVQLAEQEHRLRDLS